MASQKSFLLSKPGEETIWKKEDNFHIFISKKNRELDRKRNREYKQRDRETEIKGQRQTDRGREIETERWRQKDRDRGKEIKTERQTQRKIKINTEIQKGKFKICISE